MAVFREKNTDTKAKVNRLTRDPLWLYLLGITSFSFLLADSSSGYLISFILLIFSMTSIYILYFGNENKLHDRIYKQLARFDDQFTIISSIELTDGRRKGYFDYMVISPKGIFNLRVLDFEGTMTGYENDEFWDYVKIISPYDVMKKRVNNPLYFLHRSHDVIEEILERNFIKYIPLQSIFVINNSDSSIQTNSPVPVVKVRDLYNYIAEYRDRSNMLQVLKEVEGIFLTSPNTKYKSSSLSTEI